jgi:hypothetical protein
VRSAHGPQLPSLSLGAAAPIVTPMSSPMDRFPQCELCGWYSAHNSVQCERCTAYMN